MNDIRVNEEGVMLRPSTSDACVRRRAAEMILPNVKQWIRSNGPIEDSDEQLITILMRHVNNISGYEAVKAMEREGWVGDDELVEIMGTGAIFDAHRELTAQWVRCLGITLHLELGQKVTWRSRINGLIEGVIVKRDEEFAEYGVRLPEDKENQWHLCHAEDVQPVSDRECAA